MDAAHAAGLMTWTSAGVIDLKDPEASAKALTDRVNAVKTHPSLAFLETSDEPAWTWMKPEPRVSAETFATSYPIVKAADPDHLLYTNHAPTNLISTLAAYNAGTDIAAVDIYPVNPGNLKPQYALFEDGYQGDLNNIYISQVGEYCDKMRKVAGANRPVFMVLQAFAWEMLTDEKERDAGKVLYPSYEQTRFMAWQSIVHGANGIIYWGSYRRSLTAGPALHASPAKSPICERSSRSVPQTYRWNSTITNSAARWTTASNGSRKNTATSSTCLRATRTRAPAVLRSEGYVAGKAARRSTKKEARP